MFKRLIFASAALASGINAASAATEGSGRITFTGSIIDAPCTVLPGTQDQTVDLGQISQVALAENGATGRSTAVPFSIELENCLVATPGTRDKVTATFSGAGSTYDPESLGLIGDAAGAYILMSQSDGQKVVLGTPTSEQTIQNGNTTMSFTAQLVGGG